MPIAALLLALLACGLGVVLPGRMDAERTGFVVFAAGTFAIGAAVMDIASLTQEWLPPGVLALGWVLLRAFTRKSQPSTRPRVGALSVLLAICIAEALARMPVR